MSVNGKAQSRIEGTPLVTRMMLTVLLPILVLMSVLTAWLYTEIKGETSELMLDSGKKVAEARSSEVTAILQGFQHQVGILAENSQISASPDKDTLLQWMKEKIPLLPMAEMLFYVDSKGDATYIAANGKTGQTNLSSRGYVQDILSGKKSELITNPIISKASGQPISVIAHKVTSRSGQVEGLLAITVTLDVLSKITTSASVSESSYGWIIDGTGLIVAHPSEKARMTINVTDGDKHGFTGLNAYGKKMVAGEAGTGEILNIQGDPVTMIFSPIPGTPGWTFGISVPSDSLYASASSLSLQLVTVMLVGLIVVTVLVILASIRLVGPIKELVAAMEVVTSDDSGINARLKASGPREIQEVTVSFNDFMEKLSQSVDSIISVANNLNSQAGRLESTGATLADQIETQSTEMNNVAQAAEQLTSSFEEVARSAQQASEESIHMGDLARSGYQAITENQKQVNALSNRISNAATELKKLHHSSDQIGDVLATITSIAEQTNLLALNAAIEAARAGEHGRGFAVVADEVRTLSQQTRQSTEKTQDVIQELQQLITSTVDTMDAGASEAEQTVNRSREAEQALNDIQQAISSLEKMNHQIASAAEEQQSTLDEVNRNMTQVSSAINVLRDETREIRQQSSEISGAGQQMEQVARAI